MPALLLPCPSNPTKRLPPLLQNLEVMYDQFVAKDGRRGMDWTEVAVCIVQVRCTPQGLPWTARGARRAAPLQVPCCCAPQPASLALVCVQDGIGNANESVLAASTVHGFFSPVVLQTSVLGAPTTLHLFEYTARCVAACTCTPDDTCTACLQRRVCWQGQP